MQNSEEKSKKTAESVQNHIDQNHIDHNYYMIEMLQFPISAFAINQYYNSNFFENIKKIFKKKN
jgi:hypothetical protein